MHGLRLHTPGLTCLLWAVLWWAGVRGDGVVVVGLVVVGATYIDAHVERVRDRAEARRSLWWVRLMLPVWIERLWLVALSGIVLWSVWAQGAENDRTVRSLCALRQDLESRVAQTDKFLHDHPNGFGGIPAATLRVSEQGQIRTIQALSNLKC
jgi:hypothetical protein